MRRQPIKLKIGGGKTTLPFALKIKTPEKFGGVKVVGPKVSKLMD